MRGNRDNGGLNAGGRNYQGIDVMIILREKYGRDGIKWALEQWSADPITCVAIVGGQMNGYRTTHPQGSHYLRLTNDPGYVAGMLEFELKRCGIQSLVADPKRLPPKPERVSLFFGNTNSHYRMALPEAREKLLKILGVADNDAKDAQESTKLFV